MEDPFQNQNLPADKASKKSTNLLWLILGGIFLLVVLFCILIIFCWHKKTDDKLIKLAPIDSIVYVSARDSFLPWSDYNISLLPFSDFYSQTEKLFGLDENQFRDEILNNVSQAAFVLLSSQEIGELDSVFIFKMKTLLSPFCNQCKEQLQAEKVKTILLRQPHYLEVENNIIAIATSRQAIEKIKEVANKNIFSLASQIKEQRKNFDLLYFYLDADNLKVYLNENQQLETKIFDNFIEQDIYSGLRRKNNQWQFQIDYPVQSTNHFPLIDCLPNNFSFYVNGMNLFTIFEAWGEADQNLFKTFTQIVASFESIYDFDAADLISNFLDQPVDLIIFKSNNQTAFSFKYILVVPESGKDQTDNLENLIRIILAQKIPDEVDYLLPDDSQVTEFLARPDSWQWQRLEWQNNLKINYLSEPALNFEISYIVKDEKIFISNSIDQLKAFVNNQDIRLLDLFSDFKQADLGRSFLLFNQPEIFSFPNSYLPKGIILIQEGKTNVYGFVAD